MAVSILVVRGLLEALEHVNIPRERFFEAAGLDPTKLEEADGRISLAEYDAYHELALDMTGDEAFGLHLGEMAQAATYNLLAHLVVHAATLRHGIEALSRYHRLLLDRPAWQLVEQEHTATLLYDVAPGTLRSRRFRAELSMTGFYRMARYFARNAQPHTVAFEHAAPAYEGEYARVFDGTARFEQGFTGIVMPREMLGASTMNQDAEFHAALQAQADKRVSRLARNTTYAQRVRELLLERGASTRIDMNAVARALGLSARSLRRRLYDEGVSYNTIAEGALATLAKQLLSDDARSIQETAYTMGFSDPSAFYRAFKRWTGTTPKTYRMGRAASPEA
ncbi:MAG TPA: AraC family transcriptional regulator ligand-binding domain-containing protein [Polyangiaceae bacterium]|nr:AraC family transcriptional regulator ligand-binding domain-containing protein [Polyangiaceae bacterium]